MMRKLLAGSLACGALFVAVLACGVAVAQRQIPTCGLDCVEMNLVACLACCNTSCSGNDVLDCQDNCK